MGLLLEWVYGGLEAAPSLPETKALFEAAHKYEMLDLQYQCEQAMAEQVDIYVYPELMELATIHYASVLEQVIMTTPPAVSHTRAHERHLVGSYHGLCLCCQPHLPTGSPLLTLCHFSPGSCSC